jgi:predicted GIY-YIG superfamily endonuclease
MSPSWTIYAVTVEDRYEYIGHAKDMLHRTHEHRGDRFYGVDFAMVELGHARTKAAARRLEAHLIRQHRPPRNIQFCGPRAYKRVKTARWTGRQWLECYVRVYPGMLEPDAAREIWHRSRRRHSGAVVQKMPGWTVNKAHWMFGTRQRVGSKGVIK